MFNLDHAIAEWRRQMLAAGIKSHEVLDELESHLRDEMDQQLQSGLEPAQAFEAAAQKIGPAAAVQSEFAKVRLSRPKLRSSLFRNSCFVTAGFMFLINTFTLMQFEVGPIERALGLLALSLIALYVALLPYLQNFLFRQPRSVPGLKLASLFGHLWVVACLLGALNVIHFDLGITLSMLAWSLLAALALTAVGYDHVWRLDRGATDDFFPLLTEFSPVAQHSLFMAHQAASSLNHDFIGTEHLLLGLLTSENQVVPKILNRFGATRDAIRSEIEKLIGPGRAPSTHPTLPYTPRAKRALNLAAREAKSLKLPHVSPEVIFLGLLQEGSGVAAIALKNLGVNLNNSREEIRREIGQ